MKIFDQMHFSISVGCDDQEYVWFESSFRHCFGLNTLCRFFSYASLCQYWFHKFNSLTKNGNKNQWKVVFEWKKLKSKLILMNTPTYEHESDHQVQSNLIPSRTSHKHSLASFLFCFKLYFAFYS